MPGVTATYRSHWNTNQIRPPVGVARLTSTLASFSKIRCPLHLPQRSLVRIKSPEPKWEIITSRDTSCDITSPSTIGALGPELLHHAWAYGLVYHLDTRATTRPARGGLARLGPSTTDGEMKLLTIGIHILQYGGRSFS